MLQLRVLMLLLMMSSGEADSHLPSGCTPKVKLGMGSLCVYGFQCESSFCCPRLRVCLPDSMTPVGSDDVANMVKDGEGDKMWDIVSGGACADPWSNQNMCMQTEDGQPLDEWDQSKCGCKEEYMTMYKAGTWMCMNKAASSDACCGDSSGGAPAPADSSGGAPAPAATTSSAEGPSAKGPVLVALLILLTWTSNLLN